MIQSIVEAVNNFKLINFFSGVAKNRFLDHYNKSIPIDFTYMNGKKMEHGSCNIKVMRITEDSYTIKFFPGAYKEQPDFLIIKFKESKVIKATKEFDKEDKNFPYMEIAIAFVEKYAYLPKKRNKALEARIEKVKMYNDLTKALQKKDKEAKKALEEKNKPKTSKNKKKK